MWTIICQLSQTNVWSVLLMMRHCGFCQHSHKLWCSKWHSLGFVGKSISAFATHLHAQDTQILAKSPRIYLKDSRTLSSTIENPSLGHNRRCASYSIDQCAASFWCINGRYLPDLIQGTTNFTSLVPSPANPAQGDVASPLGPTGVFLYSFVIAT